MNNYEWLVSRLDAFIRKYYANKVIRGALVFLSCLLFYVLTVSVGEYYFYLPVWSRITIMSIFVSMGLTSLIAWVIIPLAKMAKLGSIISHEQAATIIGTHFPEVSDRLLNILQLRRQNESSASRELAEASINQKISQISVVPITGAVDLSKNRKYLPFLLPLLLAGVFILVAAPNVFKEGSSRLLQPTKAFEKPSPFQFIITNPSLIAIRNSDFILTVTTKGSALPGDAAIEIGDERIPMQPMPNHTFQYTFKNVTDAVHFKFYAAGFSSHENTLQVIQRPVLKSFNVQLSYPAYTGRKNEVRNSLSDMTLPVGTVVNWAFVTDHTDAATIRFGAGIPVALGSSSSQYKYQYRFMNDTAYTVTLHNNASAIADSYSYQVQVIPDQFPVIQLQQIKDTVSGKQLLLTGSAGDDYGITRVTFNYQVSDKNKIILNKSIPVKITAGALSSFEQYFDIQSLDLKPGQKLTYFIEAWDNDGVHGSKASRSDVMSYQAFDGAQLDSAINESSKQINSGISNSAERTKELQNDYKDAQSKMMQSSSMDWQQQQSLQEMMKKQQELKAQVENVKQRFEEKMQQSEQKNHSEQLKEKEKELDKQLNNMLNEDLKKQMEKLQELMQKLNKEQAVDAMKQLEQENKLFKMDMERIQALMKKMEMEMRMEDMANKMDELAKKQRDLQKATEQGKKDAGELSKAQKDLKDQLDKAMKEDLKETQQLAKDTKQNDRLENEEQQGKKAGDKMGESEQELNKKNNSKSGKAQDEAAENLEEMAKSLRQKAGGESQEEIEIDIKATRQILSNLIRLSFDQEDLMDEVKKTSTSSQAYVVNQEEQNRLHHNSQMIKDSLFALSKRIDKLAPTINKTTSDLERRMQRSVDALEARRTDLAVTDQQYVMTLTNNLALMLNELLANLMQMKSDGKKDGAAGSCSKPGGKKPKPGAGQQLSDIISKQKQLGESMQNMPAPGGKKPGQEGKDGQQGGQGKSGGQKGKEGDNKENGDAEQIARLAQQQADIRRQLQELSSLLNSKGMGNAKELKELEQKMDKNETDLVNRRMTPEMLARQKEIQTRLLEAEKSLREQEQDDKRASKVAADPSRPVPAALQKYITDKKQMLDLYKTVPPQLKPYYRDMVDNYFRIIGNK